MEYCSIYVTAGSEEEAAGIGRILIEERLAACANILPVKSIYRWEDSIEDDAEVVMFIKTRSSLAEKVTERVKSLHSYEVPCIVVLPIKQGNTEYLQWIEESTG
ncbi:MAG: divalent-cation tolerance protein CutA [Dehalococcoidales bacterium]|nr:MAG: divalent-cation tolerance protein CutA [Dehalococcoidales bacterium]